ncbi:nuclease-related domain-containing protein [Alkalicoccus chagannorensis]|uniref:nuclease-related domain-containing protein n=1 Tax=Alkalicoccus chagannorensis TaxID=427072 RepID=UPI00040F6C09|nr:nuclease-related domain-containing protein [Alkalicoccus chagannorensis]
MKQPSLQQPIIIDQLQALLRRLPNPHPKREEITEHLRRFKIGHAGEQTLDLQMPMIPENCKVFRNMTLRSPANGETFQIDLLILHPCFAFIGEVKNMAGTLTFDLKHGQLLRMLDGSLQSFACPVNQSSRQAFHFRLWLKKYADVNPPVLNHVLISNYQAIIEAPADHDGIYHAANLPRELMHVSKIYTRRVITKEKMKSICETLKNSNAEHRSNVLKKYHLAETEILGKLTCQHCGNQTIMRIKRSWKCTSCDWRDVNTHIHTLRDISLLIQTPLHRKTFDFIFGNIPARSTLRLIAPFSTRSGNKRLLLIDKIEEAYEKTL